MKPRYSRSLSTSTAVNLLAIMFASEVLRVRLIVSGSSASMKFTIITGPNVLRAIAIISLRAFPGVTNEIVYLCGAIMA